MIIWKGYGDLLADRAVKVIPCNAAGAMGAGLAKDVRDRWPEVYEAYRATYSPGLSPLSMSDRARQVTPVTALDGQRFLLLCSKFHWRDAANLPLIEDNLRTLLSQWQTWQIPEVAMPLLGTGLGKLDRDTMEAVIERLVGKDAALPVKLYRGLNHSHEA